MVVFSAYYIFFEMACNDSYGLFMEKLTCSSDIIGKVHSLIKSELYGEALVHIHNLVNYIITEPLNTALIFSYPALDDLCAQIGRAALELTSFSNGSNGIHKLSNDTVAFVVSRLQSSGGHTRVIEDFLRILPHQKKYIFVTDWVGRSDRLYAENYLGSIGCVIEYAPRAITPIKRLLWLQKRMIETNGRDVYLFNHHEDSIAVAAMEACKGANIYFYHHGDHHLCLGVHLKGAHHIDIHTFGFHNCRDKLYVSNNIYLPLIAENHGARSSKNPFMPGNLLTTCTAAGWNKLGVRHSISYLDVVPLLLVSTGGRHIHIGNLPYWVRWRLNRTIRNMGVDSSSFVYIPRVPSVWHSLIEMDVDLYLSSFPVTGGRTMVEVMGAGIPIAIHDHPTSRFLGGVDMAYPEAFSWREIDELIAICREVTPAQLERHGAHARSHYVKYHHPDLFQGALLEARKCEPPPIHHRKYVQDALQVALITGYSTGFIPTIHRTFYRLFKRVRSWSSRWI